MRRRPRSPYTVKEPETVPHPTPSIEWENAVHTLDKKGFVTLPSLLSPKECALLVRIYSSEDPLFSSPAISTALGDEYGEQKYFSYPLPELIAGLRAALYVRLREVANRWNELMGMPARYPYHHTTYLERCHRAGQKQPTPLLAKHSPGDFTCLRQERFDGHAFPLQAVFLLSQPQRDFTGGELILMERRPRMPWRATVVPLDQGCCVIFPVNSRPAQESGRCCRVDFRHGISQLNSGLRHSLGLPFHDRR
jgi:hypothetical protein